MGLAFMGCALVGRALIGHAIMGCALMNRAHESHAHGLRSHGSRAHGQKPNNKTDFIARRCFRFYFRVDFNKNTTFYNITQNIDNQSIKAANYKMSQLTLCLSAREVILSFCTIAIFKYFFIIIGTQCRAYRLALLLLLKENLYVYTGL